MVQKYKGVIPNLSAYAVHKNIQNESTQYVNFKHEDCQGVLLHLHYCLWKIFFHPSLQTSSVHVVHGNWDLCQKMP